MNVILHYAIYGFVTVTAFRRHSVLPSYTDSVFVEYLYIYMRVQCIYLNAIQYTETRLMNNSCHANWLFGEEFPSITDSMNHTTRSTRVLKVHSTTDKYVTKCAPYTRISINFMNSPAHDFHASSRARCGVTDARLPKD